MCIINKIGKGGHIIYRNRGGFKCNPGWASYYLSDLGKVTCVSVSNNVQILPHPSQENMCVHYHLIFRKIGNI